jgi:uncharacterized membrane protein
MEHVADTDPSSVVKQGVRFVQNYGFEWSLSAILLIAAILRFTGLTSQSYWLDELFSAGVSNPANSFSTMWHATLADVHPPLYQSILWLWYKIFGFTETTGRTLSAVIGFLGVYSLYLLGKEFYNKRVGLYAAIIASMNYFLIYYSQEVRSYALLFLFTTLSYLYFVKVIKQYSKKTFVLYLLFTNALLYTHYFGLFLVATQVFVFAFAVMALKEKRRLLLALALVTFVVVMTSIWPLFDSILSHAGRTGSWIENPQPWFVFDYLRSYVASKYLCVIFLFCGLHGTISLLKNKDQFHYRPITVVLLLWIALSYFLPYVRSITAAPLLTSRNTIITVPAIVLLVAYGLSTLRKPFLIAGGLSAIILFSAHSLSATHYYTGINKQQWRGVLTAVKNSTPSIPIYAFYSSLYGVYSELLQLGLNIQDVGLLESRIQSGDVPGCFWLLYAHENGIERFAPVLTDRGFRPVREVFLHSAKGILFSHGTELSACPKEL